MPLTIEGTIERITFHSEEDGYTVAQVQEEGRAGTCTVVGNLVGVNVGERARLTGDWTTHPKYGRQFKVEQFQVVLPATIQGIEKYLGSGLIKGIGPVTAKAIVRHFKLRTLQVIDETPDRIIEVSGVGPKRVRMIKVAWETQRHVKEIMVFLQSHGVSTSLAAKIYKQYGDDAVNVVRADPYRLARDITGIGFLTADRIARQVGIAPDAPQRVAAGVAYVLSQQSDEGHVYTPREDLVREAASLLGVEAPLVEQAIDSLHAEEQVQQETVTYQIRHPQGTTCGPESVLKEEQAVYLRPFYYGEVGVSNRLRTLLNVAQSRLAAFTDVDWDRAFAWLAGREAIQLSPEQAEAVRTALTHKVTVLTGGPGTGKTTTVRAVLELLETRQLKALLAAPTGRAAKRLSEASGRPAQTIHRLLEFSPKEGYRFQRDEANPLDADLVIVDETSMLDLLLTNHLLKAIDPASHLLLVGDVDQLPSVGAGNVLGDIIASGQAATVRLTTIFRQDPRSLIVANAHRINQGQMPVFRPDALDFFLFPEPDPDRAADLLVDVVQERIPRKFGLDPVDDVQVLAPMYRGAVGVANLNVRLQEALNPASPSRAEWRAGGRVLRVGDKVMQIRNNYDRDVFNGDIGRVSAIDREDQVLTVTIDGRPVEYDVTDLDELVHAFACSIHKAQGSEYPAVVVPVMTQHYVMLARNLLYTAVTRAKQLVVLVGTRRAIAIAVKNNRPAQRHTALDARLRGDIP
ncbi:MAG: ATP-dependent RecD-like DNA helicase [Chloroflexi bacterium]|nr:ATP-dependent RecD-like DNA helicase [Chloroflexota bacterium]